MLKRDSTSQSRSPLLTHLTATFQLGSHGGTHAPGKEPLLSPEEPPKLGLDSEELEHLTCAPEPWPDLEAHRRAGNWTGLGRPSGSWGWATAGQPSLSVGALPRV